MFTYVALFRGVNLGRKNKITMKNLKKILEMHGCTNVRTYIQSGNVLFQDPHFEVVKFIRNIGKTIEENHGFQPEIIVKDVKEIREAIQSNPFPKAKDTPQCLHLYFLAHSPKQVNLEKLNQIKSASESFQLIGNFFYLYTPDGFGCSKLANRVERLLGVKATARNWNTVIKLFEIANSSQFTTC